MCEYYTNGRKQTLFRVDGLKFFVYRGNSVWKHVAYIDMSAYLSAFTKLSEEEAALMMLDYDD